MKIELVFSDPPEPGRVTIDFDSEADRRDFIRQKIVETCMEAVDQIIDRWAPTRFPAEEALLNYRIAEKLLVRLRGDLQRILHVREANEAESKL